MMIDQDAKVIELKASLHITPSMIFNATNNQDNAPKIDINPSQQSAVTLRELERYDLSTLNI